MMNETAIKLALTRERMAEVDRAILRLVTRRQDLAREDVALRETLGSTGHDVGHHAETVTMLQREVARANSGVNVGLIWAAIAGSQPPVPDIVDCGVLVDGVESELAGVG